MADEGSDSYSEEVDEEDVPTGPPAPAEEPAVAVAKAAPDKSVRATGNRGDAPRRERGSASEKSESPARPRSSGRGRTAHRADKPPGRSGSKAPTPPPPPPFRGKGKGKHKGRSPKRTCEHCWSPVGDHDSSVAQHQYWNLECLTWQRFGDGTKMSWKEAEEGALRQKERRERRHAEQAALRATQKPPEPVVPPPTETMKIKDDEKTKKKKKKKEKEHGRATPSPSPRKHKKDRRDGSGDSHEEPKKKKRKAELIPQGDGTRRAEVVHEAESEETIEDAPPPPPPPVDVPANVDCESSESISPTARPRGKDADTDGSKRVHKDHPGLDEALPDFPVHGKGKGKGRDMRERCEFCWKPVSQFRHSQEQHRWSNARCLRWQRFLRGDCTWTHAGYYAEALLAARHEEADPYVATCHGQDTLPNDLKETDSRAKEKAKKKRRTTPFVPSPDSPKHERHHRRSPPSSDHESDHRRVRKARQLGPGAWLITTG
eukprot:s285_g17.t1